MQLAGMAAGGFSSALGSAGDAVMAAGDVLGESMEEGLLEAGEAAGDTFGDLTGGLGAAFSNRRKIKLDINHKVSVLPEWLVYACSVTGVVTFLAMYGRTLCCCYWPLACCGGCFARLWNSCFRRFACPCTNEFTYLTITVNRIIVQQTLRKWDAEKSTLRNLKVGIEYGGLCNMGSLFSVWQTMRCGSHPQQPLESEPQQLSGENVYFETRAAALPKVAKFFHEVAFSADNIEADLTHWSASQPFRASFSRDQSVPAGWTVREIRSWSADSGRWSQEYNINGATEGLALNPAELARLQGNPNDIINQFKVSNGSEHNDDVRKPPSTRLEFLGRREGSVEWPVRGRNTGDAMSLTHWGQEEDLVLVVQVLLQVGAITQANRNIAGVQQGGVSGVLHSAADATGAAVRKSANMVRSVIGSNPDTVYNIVRFVTAEIRPNHLEAGSKYHVFKGTQQLLHVHMETSASRSRNATVIRLRRCRVEVAPGRGPLKGKVKLVAFVVPRQAFLNPQHAQKLDPQSEINRTDIFQAAGHGPDHNVNLTIPVRPGDRHALLRIIPERSWAEKIGGVASNVPIAGATISRALNWATGADKHDDEMFSGAMKITIRPNEDGSSVTCEVDDQPPIDISATELAPPGTVTQVMQVPAKASQEARCSYGLEFRLSSAVKAPQSANLDFFPKKIPGRIVYGWSMFAVGMVFIGVAVGMLVFGHKLIFYDTIDAWVPDVKDVTIPGFNVSLPFSQPFKVMEGAHMDEKWFILKMMRGSVVGFVEDLEHGHPQQTAGLIIGVGVFLIALAFSVCAGGQLCPCLPKAINSCVSWFITLVAGVAVFTMSAYVVLFFWEINAHGLWDAISPLAKVIGISIVMLLITIIVISCWGCIRGLWNIATEPAIEAFSRGDSEFSVRIPELAAQELHLVKVLAQRRDGLMKTFDSLHTVGSDVVRAGMRMNVRDMTRIQKKLMETAAVSLPLFVRKASVWEDTFGKFYQSEMLHTGTAADALTSEEFHMSLIELKHRGADVPDTALASQKLFDALLELSLPGSEMKQQTQHQQDGNLIDAWSEQLLSRQRFYQAWKKATGNQQVLRFKEALENYFNKKHNMQDEEAWRSLQMSGIVPYMLLLWKRSTPAICEEYKESKDGEQKPLVVVVSLSEGDDHMLDTANLHVSLQLHYLGQEKGSVEGQNRCLGGPICCPTWPTGMVTVARGSRTVEVRMKTTPGLGAFDEYSITLWLSRAEGNRRDRDSEWWEQDYTNSLKRMVVGWEVHIGEQHVEAADHEHPIVASMFNLGGRSTQQMFRWYMPVDEDLDGSRSSDDEGTPLNQTRLRGLVSAPRRKRWWPVSEYRRILNMLGKSFERRPENGMVSIDIMSVLENFHQEHPNEASNLLIKRSVHVTRFTKDLLKSSSVHSHDFERLFDRHAGWKARAMMKSGPVAEDKLQVAAGWALEGMKVTEGCVTPWRVHDGGDPVAWLKTCELDWTVHILGKRRVVLDAHGLVHELVSTSAQALQTRHDDEPTSQMPSMEVNHMLQVLLNKQQQANATNTNDSVTYELSLPIRSRADVGILQKACHCQHMSLASRMVQSGPCNVFFDLSHDGAAIPCGVDFVKVLPASNPSEEIVGVTELVELTSKKSGLHYLPAVAVVRITHKRLLSVPVADHKQLMLHLSVLAKVHGFDITLADTRRTFARMAGVQSRADKQLRALKCLVHGEPWPMDVCCPEGHTMLYCSPIFNMSLNHTVCNNCPATKAGNGRKYYCDQGCAFTLCEICVCKLEEFKNELRFIRYMALEARSTDEEGPSSSVASGLASPGSPTNLAGSEKSEVPEHIQKLVNDLCERTPDLAVFDKKDDIISGLIEGNSPEDFLKKFVPVHGHMTCNCGCATKLRFYHWRRPAPCGTAGRRCRCKEDVGWNGPQWGCPKCPCVVCKRCGGGANAEDSPRASRSGSKDKPEGRRSGTFSPEPRPAKGDRTEPPTPAKSPPPAGGRAASGTDTGAGVGGFAASSRSLATPLRLPLPPRAGSGVSTATSGTAAPVASAKGSVAGAPAKAAT
mmetsp:Transcript_81370/g.264096  ORF Transcript_81370/g.264096 Transcript_81370/m.264096 type:complete len:2037 (+) Transcript_81370:90-6200(+)